MIFELKVLLLKRDWVVEEELGSAFENIRESLPREIPMEGACDIGEYKGNIVGEGFGEDGGQGGECIISTMSDARDGAIGEDENGSDRVDVLLNMSCNTLLVDLVLLNTTSISQPGCVENADLLKRLHTPITFRHAGTHYNAVPALQLVQVSRVSLTLIIRTTLFIGMVEDIEVVVVHGFAGEHIGNEFQE